MSLGTTEFSEKTDNKWSRNYSTTDIARIRRGKSVTEVKEAFGSVLGDPNTERSVVLVLSSISLKHIREEFTLLKAGNAKAPRLSVAVDTQLVRFSMSGARRTPAHNMSTLIAFGTSTYFVSSKATDAGS